MSTERPSSLFLRFSRSLQSHSPTSTTVPSSHRHYTDVSSCSLPILILEKHKYCSPEFEEWKERMERPIRLFIVDDYTRCITECRELLVLERLPPRFGAFCWVLITASLNDWNEYEVRQSRLWFNQFDLLMTTIYDLTICPANATDLTLGRTPRSRDSMDLMSHLVPSQAWCRV